MGTTKRLEDGATVAVIGGGPAGAFTAIHLLNRARSQGRAVRVVIFESKCHASRGEPGEVVGSYAGCPRCAGGISPRLNDALAALGICLPPEVIEASISSITVQGNWKSIYLPVPSTRPIYSVFRGTFPPGKYSTTTCFDSLLLAAATDAGAELVGSRVFRTVYDKEGKVKISYLHNSMETVLTADFVVFAGGVNDKSGRMDTQPTTMELFRQLQPAYVPPRLRKALIFELKAEEQAQLSAKGELVYVESSSGSLRLEMCSMLSKRGYITVSLVGRSVDQSLGHQENLNVIKDFLALPQIRRMLPPQMQLQVRCICNPSLVVGAAKKPFGERVAAVGDMAVSRQYKDGILAAHNMAASVAEVIMNSGVDYQSVAAGYGRTVDAIRKDNQYAVAIFVLYRWFFTNPLLSRIIYQAFVSEKKSKTTSERNFKNILWAISSGDLSYRQITWYMIQPEILWLIFKGGFLVTVRNLLSEFFFGIRWRGIARFPTAVSKDDLGARRSQLLPAWSWSAADKHLPEFECIYSIRVRAGVEAVRSLLAQFGENGRPYLNPRWVKIRRVSGEPLQQGCVIKYRIFWGAISFSIVQQPSDSADLIVYKVNGGFADGGLFCFEIKPQPDNFCLVTIYLVFDYARGTTYPGRIFCRLFKALFPEFIHDVLWNHALCELKRVAELRDAVAWEKHI